MKLSYAKDLAERVIVTYVESYLGLWIASGLGMAFVTDLSSADKALVSILPAVLAAVKGIAARAVGDPASASLAPVAPVVREDPEDAHL